jgi:hypothetical protein
MTTVANPIHACLVSLSNLEVLDCDRRQFRSARPAPNKHQNHREIADIAQIVAVCSLQ